MAASASAAISWSGRHRKVKLNVNPGAVEMTVAAEAGAVEACCY